MALEKNMDFGEWEFRSRLGAGGFGEVLKWRNRCTNLEIATKHLKNSPSLSEDEVCKIKERYKQEYKWMFELHTPYIVAGLDLQDYKFMTYLQQHNAYALPVITMEYCNSGDLRQHLQRVDNLNGLHEWEVRQVLHALRYAVEYLHNHCRIEHRDLKPENVVIHSKGNECFYKLTDFGFARRTTDNTVLKSVVGTRHYFAPEVVDTGYYNKSVDYWSLGIIAFELMCGVLPFLPHQTMYNIIMQIKSKPAICIAIKEELNNVNGESNFEFYEHIFPEHRMTTVFVKKMEGWLRLALDTNYKTRGTEPAAATDEVQAHGIKRELKIYSRLDEILETKVLNIFYLNTQKLATLEVTPNLTWEQFHSILGEQLSCKNFYCILPECRTRLKTEIRFPVDFLVEQRQHFTTKSGNPKVLLYVASLKDNENVDPCVLSSTIKQFMTRKRNEPLPKWKLAEFERQIHFMLSYEQRRLEAFIYGLYSWALTLDEDLLHLSEQCADLSKRLFAMHGHLTQYGKTIEKTHMDSSVINSHEEKCQIEQMNKKLDDNIKMCSSARRCLAEDTKNNELKQLDKEDFFGFRRFQHNLQHVMSNEERIVKCQEAVRFCLKQHLAIFSKPSRVRERKCFLMEHLSKYHEMRQDLIRICNHLDSVNHRLNEANDRFLQELNSGAGSLSMDGSLYNEVDLLEESKQLIEKMHNFII